MNFGHNLHLLSETAVTSQNKRSVQLCSSVEVCCCSHRFCSLPTCLGVGLSNFMEIVALVQESLTWPALPKEVVNFTGEISDILRDL